MPCAELPCSEWLYGFTTCVLFATAVLAWVFPALYSAYRWEDTGWGRHVMSFSLWVAMLLTFFWTTRFFGPDYPGRWIIGLGLYLFLLYNLVRRIRLLLISRDVKRSPRKGARTRRRRKAPVD